MTPEEIAKLMIDAMLTCVADTVLERNKHHLRAGAKFIHRSVMKWRNASDIDEMED